MNLEQLSTEALNATGSGLGFVIKSLAHPDRKFRVAYKMPSGKFAITRLDNGRDFFVDGSEDRYEFVIPVARIREVKATLVELSEQKATIDARMTELTSILDGLNAVG